MEDSILKQKGIKTKLSDEIATRKRALNFYSLANNFFLLSRKPIGLIALLILALEIAIPLNLIAHYEESCLC